MGATLTPERVTDTDLTILEALDFEHSKVCEFMAKQCDAEATTLIVHKCCDASYQLCQRHTTGLLEYLSVAMQYHKPVQCLRCMDPDAPYPTLIPLKDAS